MTSTMPKFNRRSRKKPLIPPPPFDLTSQIVLSASFNCPKTPDAPSSSVAKPTTAPVQPSDGLEALCTMDCTPAAACGPTYSVS